MKHIFPKNYFKEALVSLLLGIIGLCITVCPNEQYHDLLLTIGGGMFTGAIVNISTFTAHSLKNRREDLEGFLELAESIYGRFRWIKNPGNVNQHNLYDFLKILDDGKGLNRIYGRLWFVRDETRKKVHELYCVLFEIQKIQPCIMRLEMTAETSKSVKAEEIMNEFEINELEQTKKEALMIQMINDNLEDVFKKYNGSPADKINSGIDVLYDLIGKSWF